MKENRLPTRNPYRYVVPVAQQPLVQPPFKVPAASEVAGDLRLGFVGNALVVFGLLLGELVQHILIVGRSGAGKTNLFRVIMLELYRLAIPFMAFDLTKYGTRYIKEYIPSLLILRWDKEFFFNPLKPPPNVKLTEWLLTFCEVTSEIFGLLAASKSLLIEVTQFVYEKFDTKNTGVYPTIHDLHEVLGMKKTKTRSRVLIDYIDRLRNKTTGICTALGDQLNVQEGIPIQELMKYPVCIELVGLNMTEIQVWIVSLIMAWIISYKAANPHLSHLHVIMFDEASHIFGRHK